MASRHGTFNFARSAKSAFHRCRARPPPTTNRGRPPSYAAKKPPSVMEGDITRRRLIPMSIIPLHDAVASAKLVSHLAVNSSNRTALSLGYLSVYKCILYGSRCLQVMVL